MATVHYMELLVKMTDAARDQEHPKILLESIPDTPDRTKYILGETGESPLYAMEKAGRELIELGADFIAIPCVTAQYFYDDLSRRLSVPVLSICECVSEDMAARKIKKVGLLATNGTVRSRILEDSLLKNGIATVLPAEQMQQKIMDIIYGRIKQGKEIPGEVMVQISDSLREMGAEKIILGCTELSLWNRDNDAGDWFVDVLEVLAQKTVLASGAKLKNLIKPKRPQTA